MQCARARQARGDFAPARIGAQAHAQRREEIRGEREEQERASHDIRSMGCRTIQNPAGS